MTPVAALCLFLAFLYQLLALPLYRIEIGGAASIGADFVLLVVLYLATFDAARRGLLAAVSAGVAVGCIAADPLGVQVISYASAACFACRAGAMGWGESVAPRFLALTGAAAVALLVREALLWALEVEERMPDIGLALASVLYQGVLGAIVFVLLDPLRPRLVAPPRPRLLY